MKRSHAEAHPPLDPIEFDVIDVNEGNVWLSSNNTVIIHQPGSYYVHVDVATCYYGFMKVYIKVNGEVVFWIQFLEETEHGGQSRGQSAILHLTKGDTITISLDDSNKNSIEFCIYSGENDFHTAFYGFLLTPN